LVVLLVTSLSPQEAQVVDPEEDLATPQAQAWEEAMVEESTLEA
jgi:hypothetical protein